MADELVFYMNPMLSRPAYLRANQTDDQRTAQMQGAAAGR